MIFTALCCYTTSRGLLHCRPYFAFDRSISQSMHLDGSSATSLRCLLYNNGPVTKDIGTIRMAISSAQGTLRATAQLDLYLYLGGNDIDPFSLNFFFSFSAGFSLACQRVIFISIRRHLVFTHLCHYTSSCRRFTSTSIPEGRLSIMRAGWMQGTFVSPFSIAPKKTCLVWDGWTISQSISSGDSLRLPWILLRQLLHLAGYHRLRHELLLLSFRKCKSGSQAKNCASQLTTCN
jgi:hypothetical protein